MKRFEAKLPPLLVMLMIAALVLAPEVAQATLVLQFADGDSFDQDAAGGMAGPFTDPMTGLTGSITTLSVVTPQGNSNLESVSGYLGISNPAFETGESWSFSWDVATEFAGIDLVLLNLGDELTVRSDAWIGLTRTTSGDVTFASSTGTYSFVDDDNDADSDFFNVNSLGGAIPLPAGAEITLAFSSTTGAVQMEGLSFNLVAVPEPSAVLYGGLICGVVGLVYFWTSRPTAAVLQLTQQCVPMAGLPPVTQVDQPRGSTFELISGGSEEMPKRRQFEDELFLTQAGIPEEHAREGTAGQASSGTRRLLGIVYRLHTRPKSMAKRSLVRY